MAMNGKRVRKQLRNLGRKINLELQPISTSKKNRW